MKKNKTKKTANISEEEVAKAFSALAQETRLKIISMLVNEGSNGLCPCHIVEDLDITNANLSFHLKELENAGLVSKKRAGKYNHYRVNNELLDKLSSILASFSETYEKNRGDCTC